MKGVRTRGLCCGGCGEHRNGTDPDILHRAFDDGDGGCDVDHADTDI